MISPAKNPMVKKLIDLANELLRVAESLNGEDVAPVKIGAATYHRSKATIETRKRKVMLPKTQSELLSLLVANSGQLVTKDDALAQLYGEAYTQMVTRAIDEKIYVLRSILGTKWIKTIHGYGWILEEDLKCKKQ
jgi:DNA-binding response OmpR family regulator